MRLALLASCAAAVALAGCEETLQDEMAYVVPAEPAADATASSARGAAIDAALAETMPAVVEAGAAAGVVTMVAIGDEVVATDVQGWKDAAAMDPMTEDAIFAIASMTKPVTGVALMILYEEGKFALDDPVEQFLPSLAGREVLLEDGTRVAASAPFTMRQLMSHSAGLTYGGFDTSPGGQMYAEADLMNADQTMDDLVAKLADLPLLYQPGERWVYSIGVDLQGALVEELSGQPFPDFLKERIFDPLDMDDTAFFVPAEKLDRLALIHTTTDGAVTLQPGARERTPGSQPIFSSGGAGLFSTAEDYLTFSRMLLNGGETGGVRILQPETVQLMATDALENGVRQAPGTGFGLDFAVIDDPAARADMRGPGTFYWAGIWGTNFWVDPANDVAAVVLTQRAGGPIPDPANPGPDANNYAIHAIYGALDGQ